MGGEMIATLKQLMRAQNLNQKQLAEKAEITEASLCKYLKGVRTPRIDVIIKLAKALNTNVDSLLNNVEVESSAYQQLTNALARCKNELTDEDKKRLIRFLLED